MGEVEDQDLAADMILHLWYSSYIPEEYSRRLSTVAVRRIDLSLPAPFADLYTRSGARITCELTQAMIATWRFKTSIDFEFNESLATKKRERKLYVLPLPPLSPLDHLNKKHSVDFILNPPITTIGTKRC